MQRAVIREIEVLRVRGSVRFVPPSNIVIFVFLVFFHSFPMSCMYDTYILSVLTQLHLQHQNTKSPKSKRKQTQKLRQGKKKRTLNKKNRGLDKRLKTDGGIIKKVHKYNTVICNRSSGSWFQALSFRLSFLSFSSIGLSCFFR